MSDCMICQMLNSPQTRIVYEDDKAAAFLSPTPACEGHIILVPKEHHVIIEQLPDYMVAHLFHLANKLSVAAFDSLNALGTNMLIQNGTAAGQKTNHFSINILPRKEGDALDFTWKPKQLSQEEMSMVELQMKELCANIGGFETEGSRPFIAPTASDSQTDVAAKPESENSNEDYREKMFFSRRP